MKYCLLLPMISKKKTRNINKHNIFSRMLCHEDEDVDLWYCKKLPEI